MNVPIFRRFHCFLAFSAILCFARCAIADSQWFTRVWQTDDGLPNNDVNAIVQGADGYLWIGTSEALAKFDGTRFTKVPLSANANSYQGVQGLTVSRTGGLWVAPQHGAITELNFSSSKSAPQTKNFGRSIASAVVEDDAGNVWVAYGSFFAKIENGKTQQLGADESVPAGSISSYGLVKDSAGNIWMAKAKRVGIFRDGHFQLIVIAGYLGNGAQAARLAPAHTNGVWIAIGEHLFRCDTDGYMQDLGAFQPETHRTEASVVLEDHTGAVWIGTDNNGLFRYSKSGFEKIETSHPTIISLAEDNEGNIWAGTAGGGLDRISKNSIQLENVDTGASSTAIQSVCEGAPGTYWGATEDGQLVCRENGQWHPMQINSNYSEEVTCVAADKNGSVWFGTRNRLLHCWQDNHLETWTVKKGFASHTIVALLLAANGDLWIAEYGTPNAVQYLRDGILHTASFPKNLKTVSRITSLAQDANGNIWAGTISGTLLRTGGDQFIDETDLLPAKEQSILCLYGTPDGTLWIGFENGGVGRLKDGSFAQIGTAQGLQDDNISEIVADDYGWLWFGSQRGIFKVRQGELETSMADPTAPVRSVRYGRNEGLSSMEANSPSPFPYVSPNAICSSDGKLWMPLRSALAVIDPADLKQGLMTLPVFITQVMMDGQIIASSDGLATNVINLRSQKTPFHLPPGHRHLEFSFAAINFSAPENIHFRYRLEGFDNQWIDAADTERSADYSRLPAGTYQFEVEACNGDRPWNESLTSFALVVPPFFWETWWFRSMSLVFLISFVVVIARYISFRRLQMRLQVLQQQRALDAERARIAKDLHDDLGGSLTEVGLLVKMLDHYQNDPQKVSGSVQQISSSVRHVNESLDQIVWAINPRNDTLPNLIGFLGQSSMDFLRTAGIKCEIDLPDYPPKYVLTPEERHNLFLTVKEAINNIVRHAQAGEVQIHVNTDEHTLKIIIRDNGRGISNEPEKSGSDGLRNMQQRMAEIGGKCLIEAKPGAGTCVSLIFPIRSN